MKNRSLITLIIGVLIVTISGCDVLDEQVIDESLTGAGEAETVSGAIAPAYGQLAWTWRHTNYFGLQQLASDEAILPYRGGTDWYDGGKFIAVHQHLMTPSNDLITSSWNEVTKNISRTVAAIEVLRPLSEAGDTEATGALHEMIALRAYLNMLMLDSWGLAFEKESTDETSRILRGQEAIDYIQSELESVVDVINTDKGPGRLTQGAVWGLLARLHLNAAVYRDPYGTPDFTTEDMDKVIEYTDNIINSGNYALSSEYFDLFNDTNSSNPELIFAIDQRGVLNNEHNRWAYWSLSGDLYPRPEFPGADGTDGPAATPDFYQNWEDAYGNEDPAEADARFYKVETPVPADLQDLSGVSPANDQDHYFCIEATEFEVDKGILRGIIWGPRKGDDGNILTCDDGRVRIYPVINTRTRGEGETEYVDHTLNVDFTNEGRLHNTGYRFSKYQCSRTSDDCNNYSSVDIVLLRLGEVYLMRAEAKLRNGDAAGALEDVNALRAARNARPDQTPPALSSIDLDILYRELGFELYWEGLRRTNQIRFGKYEDSWTEKTASDVEKRLFPIPQSAIDGASLEEGYLEQNTGY
ncbi:RagB/SusD family nutrient uptake outer membrane protein [Fodinibius salsisoli]|uniref:RagB/SusD family nutrient uptake outer membrane protein n=1 Tax=Fodinibius salsisoli TaxID=2820877 RepID=A0ABT3PHM3_9BACT|nr:RagB/SusD family nutrient uptake outer membrane protein [Fodinibius salsisoli]MCW9705419.1 RagB/SusD family nutrient uptake outer membrane protein [Fodinibius salsisoli]